MSELKKERVPWGETLSDFVYELVENQKTESLEFNALKSVYGIQKLRLIYKEERTRRRKETEDGKKTSGS